MVFMDLHVGNVHGCHVHVKEVIILLYSGMDIIVDQRGRIVFVVFVIVVEVEVEVVSYLVFL